VTTRPVGKLGRLPGKIPVGLRDLGYYAAGPLPKAPAQVQVPSVGDWGMLGNDQYGDCGVAGLEHLFMSDAALTKEHEHFASAQQAVDYYLTYTGGQDSGVVLSDYLAYVRQNPFYGKKVDSFAPVAVQDIPTLQTAVFIYGAAYTGIAVTDTMQEAFSAHQPWTLDIINAGQVVGGHCIPIVGYSDNWLYAVTWGGLQQISYSAWHAIASEAWAVITGEFVGRHGDGRGINIAALRADLDRLAA
jgi:hypothetical protein